MFEMYILLEKSSDKYLEGLQMNFVMLLKI
jgi:hypothetical protein